MSVFLNSSSYRCLSATDTTQFTAGWNQQKVDMYSEDMLVSVIYQNEHKKDVIAIDAEESVLIYEAKLKQLLAVNKISYRQRSILVL